MKFDSLSRSTVKITLSEEDMNRYSLCAESITQKTDEAKRTLAGLLKKERLFRGSNARRLFLEAFPRANGGCILYVSGLEEAENNAPVGKAVCTVSGLDCFIRLCAGIYRICDGESAALADNGRYSLLLLAPQKQLSAVLRVMSEYGEASTDEVEIRRLSECCKNICPSGAARTFARLL